MNIICKITDADVNGDNYDNITAENYMPKTRTSARGIVLRNDGKIAVFYKSNKNEYKLPGGGMENDENPEETFKREVLEETGCIVEIVEQLGITEEYKNKTNFKQISNIFLGKVIEDTNTLHLTKKETDEGAKLLWETPEKALELITNCFDNLIGSNYESVYTTRFIVLRDRKILEYYINKYVK